MNAPEVSECVSVVALVVSFFAAIVANGTGVPVASFTVPEMLVSSAVGMLCANPQFGVKKETILTTKTNFISFVCMIAPPRLQSIFARDADPSTKDVSGVSLALSSRIGHCS